MADRRAAERAGRRAEWLAAMALRLKGYRIVARRYRSPKGEIDLIARRGRVLAFVEVKARGREADAAAALHGRARMRIVDAAQAFVGQHAAVAALDMRFDAVLVTPGRWPKHVMDAWRP